MRTYVELPDGLVLETADPDLWKEGKRLTKAEGQRRLRDDALARLRAMIQPGDTIHCILRHVSRSGMSRRISFYHGDTMLDRYILNLGLGASGKGDGVRVDGCGMDMGFSVVYNLGATLWPKGTDTPHGMRNGEPDSDGGYALKSRWL